MVPTAKMPPPNNASQNTSTKPMTSLLPEPSTAPAAVHQPAQVSPSSLQSAAEQQQATFSPDASVAEPVARCTDQTVASLQTQQVQNTPDATASLSQPAVLENAAAVPHEQATVNSSQQSSKATAQEASLPDTAMQSEQSELFSVAEPNSKKEPNQALPVSHGSTGKPADSLEIVMNQSSNQHALDSLRNKDKAEGSEVVRSQAPQPNQDVYTAHPVLQPSITSVDADSGQLLDASVDQVAVRPHEQDPASAVHDDIVLQSTTGISLRATDATSISDAFRMGLHSTSGTIQKTQKPFSWRKHGRSWRYKK